MEQDGLIWDVFLKEFVKKLVLLVPARFSKDRRLRRALGKPQEQALRVFLSPGTNIKSFLFIQLRRERGTLF